MPETPKVDLEEHIFGSKGPTGTPPKGPSEEDWRHRIAIASLKKSRGNRVVVGEQIKGPVQQTIDGQKVPAKPPKTSVNVSTRVVYEGKGPDDLDGKYPALELGIIGHKVAEAVFLYRSNHANEPLRHMATMPPEDAKEISKICQTIIKAHHEGRKKDDFTNDLRKILSYPTQTLFDNQEIQAASGQKAAVQRYQDRYDEATEIGAKINF